MRLVLDARARAFLRRVPVTTVYSGIELLLIAVLAVQAARLVWAVLTPVDPVGIWRPEQDGVSGSAEAILRGFDPFFRVSGGDAAGPSVVTNLQLTLFGIRIDEMQGGGSAIIAGPDNIQQSIGVGQEIMPGVRLKAVAFDHVTIDRGGVAENLFLAQTDQPPPAPALPSGPPLIGGASEVLRPTITKQSGVTAAQLRSDVGFIPRIDNGRITGVTVRAQGSGAAFHTLNLHDGDVVTQIGGVPITGPGDLQRLGTQFPNGGATSLTVDRGGSTVTLGIEIAGQ